MPFISRTRLNALEDVVSSEIVALEEHVHDLETKMASVRSSNDLIKRRLVDLEIDWQDRMNAEQGAQVKRRDREVGAAERRTMYWSTLATMQLVFILIFMVPSRYLHYLILWTPPVTFLSILLCVLIICGARFHHLIERSIK